MKLVVISPDDAASTQHSDISFRLGLRRSLSRRGVHIIDRFEPGHSTPDVDAVLILGGDRDSIEDLSSIGAPLVLLDDTAPHGIAAMKRDHSHHKRRMLSDYDLILLCGGGPKACAEYLRMGARSTALLSPGAIDADRMTPSSNSPVWDLVFVGDRHGESGKRAEDMVFGAVSALHAKRFLVIGSGWHDSSNPVNVTCIDRPERDILRSTISSSRFVLHITSDTGRRYGFCPTSWFFEVAASGACLISDAWPGLCSFLELGKEVLVAGSFRDVAMYLNSFSAREASRVGQAARCRILADHTCDARADELLSLIEKLRAGRMEKGMVLR